MAQTDFHHHECGSTPALLLQLLHSVDKEQRTRRRAQLPFVLCFCVPLIVRVRFKFPTRLGSVSFAVRCLPTHSHYKNEIVRRALPEASALHKRVSLCTRCLIMTLFPALNTVASRGKLTLKKSFSASGPRRIKLAFRRANLAARVSCFPQPRVQLLTRNGLSVFRTTLTPPDGIQVARAITKRRVRNYYVRFPTAAAYIYLERGRRLSTPRVTTAVNGTNLILRKRGSKEATAHPTLRIKR